MARAASSPPDAGAAHTGSFGGLFTSGPSAFAARQDILTSPGSVFTAMVATTASTTASGGRVYLGVGGNAGGTISAVFAPNTQEVLIQDNTGWGFTNMATGAAVLNVNTWYQLQLSWALNGDMQASVYDETGTTLIAQTPVWASGNTTPGWLTYRGFAVTGNSMVDDVTGSAVPEPATIAALSLGIVALLARRRKG